MPRERAARDLARCRRRLRLQGQALSGGDASSPGRRGGCGARCAGSATRSESFVADNQARDHLTHAELALDADGHFLALRVETIANLGAYVSTFGAAIPSAIYSALLAGVYRTPAIFVEVDRRLHQHDADRRLSRRRPAGGLLRAGAAGRPRRRASSASTAPRSGGAISSRRPRCPTRRRSVRPTTAAISRRCSRALLELADYDGFAKRRAAAARARPAARHRHGLLCRIVGRRAVALCRRARRARRLLRGRARSACEPDGAVRAARHPQSRPGPRHHVRADPLVAARRAGRQDRDRRGRHRPGALRHRHLRLALDRGRRLRARPRRRQDRRQGQADRRASARGRGRRHRVSPTARSRSPAPTGASRFARGRARRLRRRTTIPLETSSPGCRTPRSTIRRASPSATAPTSARSRSIRRPARSSSSATGRSTTSAP